MKINCLNSMTLIILILLFKSIDSFADVNVTKSPSGVINSVEFLDVNGNVIKKFNSGSVEPDLVGAISSQSALASGHTVNRPLHNVSILSASNSVLVTESISYQHDEKTYLDTGRPTYINNKATLYDVNGIPISVFDNLECKPVALSGNGELVACLYTPPVLGDIGKNAPNYLTKDNLYVYNRANKLILHTSESPFSTSKAIFSPNGKWFVYIARESSSSMVRKIKTFNLGNKVPTSKIILNREDLLSYTRITNAGEIIKEEYEWYEKTKGVWLSRIKNKKILYIIGE